MTRRILELTGFVLLVVFIASTAAEAQDWRGMARVGGKVVDEETGQPIEGVAVKATLPASGNRGPDESKSNAKGEWAIGGVASGNWALDFIKDGYETRSISLPISESGGRRPMEVRLKKKAAPPPDPNAEIKAKLTEAAAKMNAKQYAEARAIYEELSAKHPEVKQFRPLIARTYHGEGNTAAAIEHLRKASAEDPGNIEVRLLLGTTLMEAGQAEEARQILASVDDSKVIDPTVFVNIGIGLINDKKHAEAIPWFDKAIARFPQHPDGYYYRGIAYLSLGKTPAAKADLEKYVSLAPADASELATAKQILATIK
ncbi:MAG TPA: tetratricopeptide repeat protein [Vicinamibacterales bacterium]|nr:tetratricopeptide repeat protein [Vicinamibacterales bacterium]